MPHHHPPHIMGDNHVNTSNDSAPPLKIKSKILNLQPEKEREVGIEQIRKKDYHLHFYPWLANVAHIYLKLHFDGQILKASLIWQLAFFFFKKKKETIKGG